MGTPKLEKLNFVHTYLCSYKSKEVADMLSLNRVVIFDWSNVIHLEIKESGS
jgi:4-hydroxy-3-methylbut-2-en-1-yl diphosphate synthase IspG/GcpE